LFPADGGDGDCSPSNDFTDIPQLAGYLNASMVYSALAFDAYTWRINHDASGALDLDVYFNIQQLA
jgi:hypothetical protein